MGRQPPAAAEQGPLPSHSEFPRVLNVTAQYSWLMRGPPGHCRHEGQSFYGGMPWALWGAKQHLWPLPLDARGHPQL